jgi:HAD superfamily hydrolase (TIGR01490 family)
LDIVPRGPTAAAFFDLDRTLISGSSAFTFAFAAWRSNLVPSVQFARDAKEALAFRMNGASDDTTVQTRERILGAISAQIIPKLLDRVRPEAKLLIDRHRHADRDTYIVSASPIEVVAPLAQALGMTGGIGTVAEVVDGHYTGKLVGPFCYGPGKVEAINELARWDGYELDRCYAYSDSASDLPMMEAVGHPVAVNPDGPLERVARQRGWPIVIFNARTKTVVRRSSAAAGAAALAGATFAAGLKLGARRVAPR